MIRVYAQDHDRIVVLDEFDTEEEAKEFMEKDYTAVSEISEDILVIPKENMFMNYVARFIHEEPDELPF